MLVCSGPALPVAALLLLRVLVKAGNRRNYFIAVVLLAFGTLNVAFHFLAIDARPDLAMRAVYASAGIVVLLVGVIGGRVIPMFTANAIPGFVTRRWRAVEPFTLATFAADACALDGRIVAVLALSACGAHLARMIGWRSYAVRARPILAILHLAYAWLPIGFALLALCALGSPRVPHSLAVQCLCHRRDRRRDHRDDHAHRARTYGPAAHRRPARHRTLCARAGGGCIARARTARDACMHLIWIFAAGICWGFAFALYVAAYAAPLFRPREDGKPG